MKKNEREREREREGRGWRGKKIRKPQIHDMDNDVIEK